MLIRTTTDPVTLHDVPFPELHPCLYEGDGENGLEIYFESEQTRQDYMDLRPHHTSVLVSNYSESYEAEG